MSLADVIRNARNARDISRDDSFVEFLHYLASWHHDMDTKDIIYVVEKPYKWEKEFDSFKEDYDNSEAYFLFGSDDDGETIFYYGMDGHGDHQFGSSYKEAKAYITKEEAFKVSKLICDEYTGEWAEPCRVEQFDQFGKLPF